MPSGKFQAQRSVSPGRGAFAFEAHAILKLLVGMLSPLSDLFAGVAPALEVAEDLIQICFLVHGGLLVGGARLNREFRQEGTEHLP